MQPVTRILINTAGSGKTRLLLDGLCQRWGFYFAADEREIGSEDFRRIVCDLTTYRDYESGSMTLESIDHTRETASRALSQVLLSHFLLLGLLVEEVQAQCTRRTKSIALVAISPVMGTFTSATCGDFWLGSFSGTCSTSPTCQSF